MKVFGASLLITGTTIGAGILALPLVTGLAGFFPSILLLIAYWLFMTYTAFLILEATLWFKKDTNLITIAEDTLGRFGKWITWIFYLFLLYALTTAYLSLSSPLLLDLFEWTSGIRPEPWIGFFPLLIVFGFFIYHGTKWVDHINRWMMLGLVITFLTIFFSLSSEVNTTLLTFTSWGELPKALGLVATSFGYHIIIPSLVTYLDRDAKQCKKAIWIGSFIPLIGYLIWEGLVLGIIPVSGAISFNEGIATHLSSADLLVEMSSNELLRGVLNLFSFFLIITSFLGVSLSLFDFLADGLKIKKNTLGRGTLYLLTFGPPLLICLNNPGIFLEALDYAGVFGVVTLLVLLPTLMVYFGRPIHAKDSHYRVKGGNFALGIVALLAILIIGHEISTW
ncbi:hypothetical protein N9Y92_03660 [Chlamydiales bacterium]|nr:hypothetical protein [Chlamydiales bacterium]